MNPPSLPADPGEAGKATLEGIDSDNDGVRDDVQRYIAITYPESARVRAALTQKTQAFQQQFVGRASPGDAALADNLLSAASACLAYVVGSREASQLGSALQTQFLNTDLRWEALHEFERMLQGHSPPAIAPSMRRTACTVDVDSLPN